jgi:hypothetical protein
VLTMACRQSKNVSVIHSFSRTLTAQVAKAAALPVP